MRRLVYQSVRCAWSWVIAHEPKMWHQAMLKDVSPVFSQAVNLKRNNGSSPSSNGWNDIGSGSIANLNIQAAFWRGKQLTYQVRMTLIILEPFVWRVRQICRPDSDRHTFIGELDAPFPGLGVI